MKRLRTSEKNRIERIIHMAEGMKELATRVEKDLSKVVSKKGHLSLQERMNLFAGIHFSMTFGNLNMKANARVLLAFMNEYKDDKRTKE